MSSTPTAGEAVEGSHTGAFRVLDWGHLLLTAVIFGSAFLWIALALRSLTPGFIAFSRVALGAAVLALFASARVRPDRKDWWTLVAAGIIGQAAPALLFALAQQRISSSLTGMLISAVPIFTAALAAILTRTLPTGTRVAGLAVGFVGIFFLSLPTLGSATAELSGVVMVLIAALCYSTASLMYAPLQQRYGALSVVMWSLVAATVVLAPFGFIGLAQSSFEPLPILALLILGIVGTGIARSLLVAAIGRLGSVRASIVGYMVPVFALVLGVAILHETVEPVQIAGAGLALGGGYLISLAKRTQHDSQTADRDLG